MITPPDKTHLRSQLGLWTRKVSNQWTDEKFRKTVIDFLDDFVRTRTWVKSWEVDEHFVGAKGRSTDINRRKRDKDENLTRGPDNLAYPDGVNQSDKPPVLVLKVIRVQGSDIEVGLTFDNGRQTEPDTLDMALKAAAMLWDTSK